MDLIYCDKIFTGNEFLEKVYIGVENNIIKYIGNEKINSYVNFKDYSGYCLYPQLIDIHTHGAIGIDTNNALAEDFLRLADYNKNCGLGAFMPTAVTDSYENIEKVLIEVRKAMKMQKDGSNKGAEILGVFLEGIFINPQKKGSHIEKYIREIDMEFIEKLSKKYNDVLRRIIIAPELENSEKAAEILIKAGVKVCMGHSNGSYSECTDLMSAGADSFVHIFNAMGSFNHRKSGILSAALLENAYVEIICDFVHTDKNAVKLLLKCKDTDKIMLITDNVCAKGTKGEKCKLGDMEVFIKDNKAVIKDGTLAGGNSDIIDGIHNMISLGVDPKNAFNMGSLNIAKYLGIDNRYGKIEVGRKAEFYVEKV